MANETTVGGILAWLKLDATQFHHEIEQAITEVEALSGTDATVRVKADTAVAETKLAATERQVEKLDKANARVAVSSKQAGNGMGALATAIITLGPAIVPLAAGAVGLGAAFGGLGSAGVLAIVGVNREMKAGTALGLTYKATIKDLGGSFNQLTHVAAANTLGSFQAAVADLQARTPQLTRAVGGFATMAGSTAANLTGGLVSAFLALEPLMRDAGAYVLTLSKRFSDAMSGPGVVSFGDYIRSVFPQVMQALESIVTAAGHLIASLAPLGLGVLSSLKVFADLINAIPVDVLAQLATLAGSVFIGFRAWQGLSAIVGRLGSAIFALGASAAATATTMTVLSGVAGGIGIAIAALAFVMARNAEANRQSEQATNDYADALRASNGVIDESIRLTAAKRLSDSGALDLARQLGVSQATATDVVLGTAGATGLLKAQLDASLGSVQAHASALDGMTDAFLGSAGGQGAFSQQLAAGGVAMDKSANASTYSAKALDDYNTKARALADSLGLEHHALDAGVVKQKDLAAATETNAGATAAAAVEAKNLAGAYGVAVPTFTAAADGQKKHADQAAAATLQMQLENNAAGLLKQGLDALNGKSLDLSTAQTSAASAALALGKSLKDNGTSLSTNTEKGVANRQAIERKAQADQALAEATAKSTGSTKAGTKSLADSKAALEKSLKAQGNLTPAIQAYIDKIYKIPKVAPTKTEVDATLAEARLKHIQDLLNTLANGVSIPATLHYTYTGQLPNGGTNTHGGSDAGTGGRDPKKGATGGLIANGIQRMAGGGLIRGAGTGTSDSIPARIIGSQKPLLVANGEFISTDASRRRNMAALAAGNHGATLAVAGDAGRSVTNDHRFQAENVTIVTPDVHSFRREMRSTSYRAKARPGR